MAVKKRKVKPLGILIILFLLASVFLISVGGSVIYFGSPVDKNDTEDVEVKSNPDILVTLEHSPVTVEMNKPVSIDYLIDTNYEIAEGKISIWAFVEDDIIEPPFCSIPDAVSVLLNFI